MDFKGTQFEKEIILWGVRWYVAYPISYRQLEEMRGERGGHRRSLHAQSEGHQVCAGGGFAKVSCSPRRTRQLRRQRNSTLWLHKSL
jgi:hypothetical protein